MSFNPSNDPQVRRPIRTGTLLALAVAAAVLVGSSVAYANDAPPPVRSKKTARWNAALLEPGYGWWCNTMECARGRPACTLGVTTCKEQRRAWGFSYYLWFPDNQASPKEPGGWLVSAHPTRAQCEDMRRIVLADEGEGGEGYSSVSRCTSLGDRPLAPLPPGRGWWCTRAKSLALDVETSSCARARAECVAGTAELGSAKAKSTVGELELIHACRRATTAWASEVKLPNPRFKVFETRADCEAVSFGATCHKVR